MPQPIPLNLNVAIGQTIVVGPSISYCGKCDAQVRPGIDTQCTNPEHGATFRYTATSTAGDKPLADYATQFKGMWPDLAFIGAAIPANHRADTAWMITERWPS